MMHLQARAALLFTLAAFLQLSPTIASYQECAQQSSGLPTLSVSSLTNSIAAQCPNLGIDTSDCVADVSDSNLVNSCKSAGGEVYDSDFSISCPSSDADGTQKLTFSNYFICSAKVCTTDDMKANFEASDLGSAFGYGCSVQNFAIASGTMAIRVCTTLIGALVAGLYFLVDVF